MPSSSPSRLARACCRRLCRLLPAPLALLALHAAQASTEPEVLVAYRDKPPYSTTTNGRPSGVLIDKTRRVFETAGVPYRLAEMPVKRIASEIEANQQAICSPGWYRLPERERSGKFSAAIHRDAPQLVLTSHARAAAVRAHVNLRALLRDERMQLLVLEGVSYGADLDALVAARPQRPQSAVGTSLQVGRMIAAERGDYMFIDQADYDFLRRADARTAAAVEIVRFADMPPGIQRYYWCSRKVDAPLLSRIDAAIHKLGLDQ